MALFDDVEALNGTKILKNKEGEKNLPQNCHCMQP